MAVSAALVIVSDNGLFRGEVFELGASVARLQVRERPDDEFVDVVLGFSAESDYAQQRSAIGAICGRYANRIRRGTFELDGVHHSLLINIGENHLHGGPDGFQYRRWNSERLSDSSVRLQLTSEHGDQGYPGRLDVSVIIKLTDWGIEFAYHATTDQATVVNLTHHGYFNLSGHNAATIPTDDHRLWINASHVTDVDDGIIPTGSLLPVADTPFDFRTERHIGEAIDSDHRLTRICNGYDQNWVLDRKQADELEHVASLYSETTRIRMDCHTTEPGLQFYAGNFLSELTGKDGALYKRRSGICLETQHFPDSPNHPTFPSTILRPDKPFTSVTQYRFSFSSRE